MNLGQLRTTLRQRLDDQAAPYLWADAELNEYINEAQREACIRANLIYDETSAVTSITVVASTSTYTHSPFIKSVDRVYLNSTKRALGRFSQPEMDFRRPNWRNATGVPTWFCEEPQTLILYPNPTAADTLKLAVWRLPLEDMAADGDAPEIDQQYHLRMLDWAAHLAYRKRDADTENAGRASDHEQKFTASFGERPDANVQRQRKIKRVPVVRPRW